MMAMSDGLKDDAFLRNIADEVLNIINPPEPDKRDQTSPEPEANGLEPNNQTLANGNIHPDPFSIQNGVAIPVEGSATGAVDQTVDHTIGLTHSDADSMLSAHAPFTSQSQESPTPESAYDYDTNRHHDNGISIASVPSSSSLERVMTILPFRSKGVGATTTAEEHCRRRRSDTQTPQFGN
jgi:hypothetical protein